MAPTRAARDFRSARVKVGEVGFRIEFGRPGVGVWFCDIQKMRHALARVEKQIDTVVALGIGARCESDGRENVVAPILPNLGYSLERAKINIGIGKITNGAAEPVTQTQLLSR